MSAAITTSTTVRRAVLALAVGLALLVSPARAASPRVQVVEGAAECGGQAYDKLVVPSLPGGFTCLTRAVDAFTTDRVATGQRAVPATSPPVCYGDGQTGPRVQLIYGWYDGVPNRARSMVPYIQQVMAPRMQAMIKAASGGKDLGMRFAFAKGCKGIDVKVVRFPASVISADPSGVAAPQFGRMIDYLVSLGLDRNDRKYQILWDGWTSQGVCGLGQSIGSDLPSAVNPQHGTPTVGGYTDPTQPVTRAAGRNSSTTQYSVVWNHVFGPRGPSCFELDQSRVGGQMHELFHTLGAVVASAPHSDGGGHCLDKPSVMCAADSGIPMCSNKQVQVLDCGQDDYWNPNPAPGSYLATHNNIADSGFFGPQPQDALVGAPL